MVKTYLHWPWFCREIPNNLGIKASKLHQNIFLVSAHSHEALTISLHSQTTWVFMNIYIWIFWNKCEIYFFSAYIYNQHLLSNTFIFLHLFLNESLSLLEPVKQWQRRCPSGTRLRNTALDEVLYCWTCVNDKLVYELWTPLLSDPLKIFITSNIMPSK